MPVRVSVSLAKEIGSPESGSLDVGCALEFDDESSAPLNLETLQRNVRRATLACQRAIQEELAEQQHVHGAAASSRCGSNNMEPQQ